MAKKDAEKVVELVQSGLMRVCDDSGGSLELVMWRGDPAVIVDGKQIIRRTTLVHALAGRAVGGQQDDD